MKLTVNSKETEVKDGCTIAELPPFWHFLRKVSP